LNDTLEFNAANIGGGLDIAGKANVSLNPFTVANVINNSPDNIYGSYTLVDCLQVAGFPSPGTAGVAGAFTVTARDNAGKTMTGYTGTVHFTSSDPQAVLPADYTFTSTDQGVHTFSATLKTAGTQSIAVTDKNTPTFTGAQSGITVNAAAASHLVVAGYPSPRLAGLTCSFTVMATDPLRQHRTELYRHGRLQQQCQPGQPAGGVHLHGRRQRGAHLQRRLADGRHPVYHRQGQSHAHHYRPANWHRD